jgi:hypothetical protein
MEKEGGGGGGEEDTEEGEGEQTRRAVEEAKGAALGTGKGLGVCVQACVRAFLERARCMENGKEIAWCEKPGEMSHWARFCCPLAGWPAFFQGKMGVSSAGTDPGELMDFPCKTPKSFNQALSVLVFCGFVINFKFHGYCCVCLLPPWNLRRAVNRMMAAKQNKANLKSKGDLFRYSKRSGGSIGSWTFLIKSPQSHVCTHLTSHHLHILVVSSHLMHSISLIGE